METISGPSQTKARKGHRCDFCNYPINKGDSYMRSVHTFSGDIYTWKSHLDCDRLATTLNMYERCDEGLTSDAFQECVVNEYHNLEGPKLPRNSDFKEYLDFVKIKTLIVNSKEFWEIVKSEYKKDSFICWSSETFSKTWGTRKGSEYIKELAEEFLYSYTRQVDVAVDTLWVLFVSGRFSPNCTEWVDVRVDFIDWCIKKFE